MARIASSWDAVGLKSKEGETNRFGILGPGPRHRMLGNDPRSPTLVDCHRGRPYCPRHEVVPGASRMTGPPAGEHHLFIVRRDASDVAQFLADQFPGDSNVTVVVDRRRGDRRNASERVDGERRVEDRRRRGDVEETLRRHSHAFVTVNSA